jgi:hypothetical protein
MGALPLDPGRLRQRRSPVNLAPLGWLAFIAATVIFVLIAIKTITDFSVAYWGFALVAFGLAFSGWWGAQNRSGPS